MLKLSLTKSALVGGATVAGIGILAAAAFAAVPSYHISAGTKTSGTTAYSAAANGTSSKPAVLFTDTTKNRQLTCQSASAAGIMKLGKVSGTKAATITKTTWKTCSGLGLTLVPKQSGTWYINGDAPTSNGITKVHISNITAHISSTVGCSLDVTGNADGTYNNATGKLTMAPRKGSGHVLTLSNVSSGCFGLLSNNDKATFQAAYVVKTANGKLKITN
jgi:hypothetical protein